MADQPFLQSLFSPSDDSDNPFKLPPLTQDKAETPAASQPDATPADTAPADTRRPSKVTNWMPPADLQPVFEAAARKFNVPVNVVMALANQESHYNPSAIGQKTPYGRAKGIMQYLDATAKGLGINPFDPNEAIPAAAKQIRERLDKGYSLEDAIMEHFAGPDRSKWGPKTAQYGRDVMAKVGRIGQYMPSAPAAQPDAATQQSDDTKDLIPLTAEQAKRIEGGEDADVVLGLKDEPAAPRTTTQQYLTDPLKRGVLGMKQGFSANAAMANARQLDVIGRVDRGEKVPDMEDPAGYQYMGPEQRDAYKQQVGGLFKQEAERTAALGKEASTIPQDPIVAAASNAKSFDEWWGYFKQAPFKFIANTGVESLPNMAPGLVLGAATGGIGGLAGAAAGMGAGSYMVDYPATVLSALQEAGVNTQDPQALVKAFSDARLMENVRKQAHAHATVVGALDAASGGRAGATIIPGKTLMREGANLGLKTIEQGALGAAGEAGGEIAQGKQNLDWGNVMGEFAGEVAGAPTEIAGATAAKAWEARNKIGGGKDATPQPDASATPQAAAAQPTATPAAQPAPATPSGPLTAAAEKAAGVPSDGKSYVVKGEDGRDYHLNPDDGTLTPVETASGPLTAAAEAVAADVAVPAADAAPAEAQAATPAPEQQQADAAQEAEPARPAKPEPAALEDMTEEQLRDRLKYIAGQAKVTGWNKTMVAERKRVEREIGKRKDAVPRTISDVLNFNPDDLGTFSKRDDANAAMLKAAEATGKPFEVIEKDGKFTIQRLKEGASDQGTDTAGVRVRDDSAQGTEAAPASRGGEPTGSATPEKPAGGGTTAAGQPQPGDRASVPGANAATDRQPALADIDAELEAAQAAWAQSHSEANRQRLQAARARKEGAAPATVPEASPKRTKALKRIEKGTAFFGTPEKTQAFIDEHGIGDTHEVKQTGKKRFEVVAKGAENEQKQGNTDRVAAAGDVGSAGAVADQAQDLGNGGNASISEGDRSVGATSASQIDTAAHEAATSPENSLPEPTQAQKEAGNYKKGHISFQGLDIAIENPRGSERSGVDASGKTWAHTMSDHYGYLKRTTGADGDQVDVYVGPNPDASHVYVVDQIDQDTGKFDEHKSMLGFNSREEAVKAYSSNFDKGWKVGPVREMTVDEFKTWLKDGDTSKPAAEAPTDHRNASQRDIFSKNLDEITDPQEAKAYIEALRTEILTSERTGLGSNRAWIMRHPKAFVASIDLDSLKWVNDNMGHGAGDQMIAAVGDAMRAAGLADDAFHISGDEFYAQADSEAGLRGALEAARKALKQQTIHGEGIEFKEPGFSFGIGRDVTEAERNLHVDKQEREVTGERASRGERPRGAAQASQPNQDAGRGKGGGRKTARTGTGEAGQGAEVNARAETDLAKAADAAAEAAPAVPADGAAAADRGPVAATPETEPAKVGKGGSSRRPKQEPMPRQDFDSKAGVGKIWAVKERYGDRYGVSWSSTDIIGADTMEEAAAIAKAVADSGADNIADMRMVAHAAAGNALAPRPAKPKPVAAPTALFQDNKIFTADAVEKARARLKSKLTQLNSGIDPEIMMDGIVISGAYIEAGVRRFSDYAKAMIDDLGQAITPFLLSFYEAARSYPGIDTDGLSTPATARKQHEALMAELAETPKSSTLPIEEVKQNDNRADQSGLEAPDRTGVPGADAGRGNNPQQGSAQLDFGDLEAGQPENVRAPAEGGDGGPAGVRAPAEDVGAPGGTDAGRPAGNGRKGTGRKGNPDAGARGGRSGSGRKTAAADAVRDEKHPDSVSPANPGPGDFSIDDPLKIVGGGQAARFDKNRAAIELRNRLIDEGRQPTREEQEVLAGYTGWGSFGQELFQGAWENPKPKQGWEARDAWLRDNLGKSEWEGMQRSIINAHYTDPPTVLAMWDMVRRMGFAGGRVLEPSIGIGNFFGMMPPELAGRSQRAGIELDPVTGSMAQMLYPGANIKIMGYEQSKTPDNFYDLVIGNWPFADVSPADRRYNRLSPVLHDYFFLKALDQTRPGGIVIGITSAGTMDKKDSSVRAEMAKKGELVAAFRLPSGAFEEYAGTKVVTDIIVLRKRAEPAGIVANEGWIRSKEYQTKAGEPVFVNEYYHANPQNVIGEIDYGHGTTTFRPGLIVHRPADMMEQLRRIVSMVPEGAYQADTRGKQISYVTNHTDDRTNALTKTKDGLFIVRGEYLAPANEVAKYTLKSPDATAKREAQLSALIDLRQLYGKLIDAERAGDATKERKALRQAFDAFKDAHGSYSESFGLQYLRKIDDPFYPALAALETWTEDRDGNRTYKPAAILSENTIRGAKALKNPSITDAFVLARNESVNPSPERIAEIAGKSVAEVRTALIDAGAAFETPGGDFVPSDIYLSGNVREKLRQAQAGIDQGNAAMQRNVDALKEVIPADVPYYKIETQMGATWVPPKVYADYVAHMLGLPDASGIEVGFQAGAWKVDFPAELNHRTEAKSGFGTEWVKFKRLVRAAIANQTINVKRKDDEGVEYIDQEATKEANAKIADMRMKFGEWLWSEPTRRVELEQEYNEVRNAYATPTFDGSFLGFQGMALSLGRGPFNLREHQVNAIWRGLVTRKSLNAHEVGSGKTFTLTGIAVESRRYGIAKKPLLFAHNANSKSVAHEAQQMYPAAKVLYVDNLSKENAKTRMMQIANDDWDMVVLPHSLIDRIGFKEETLMAMAQQDLDDLMLAAEEAAKEDNVTIKPEMLEDEKELGKLRSVTAKQLVKQRMRIIETIKKLAQQASREDSIAFEDMGVDMILVDEAHEFKKPPIATKMKMKGLQTQTSNRSIAMSFITKYVRGMNNGGNVHLFTGTPITNTMTEVFHMMRYMMQEEMASTGLADWDGWFGSFAREVNDVELSSTGEYEAVTRLQSFINVPELRRMIGQYMDVVFADDMPEMKPRSVNGKKLSDKDLTDAERAELLNGRTENAQDRPYKKVVNESSDMTPEQTAVFRQVQQLAKTWRNMGKKARKDAMSRGAPEVPIIHDAIAEKASFDVRLVNSIENAGKEGTPEMEPHPNSKPARVVKNLVELYRSAPDANQVVFMEQGMSKTVTRSEGEPGMKVQKTYPAFSTMLDMIERLVQAGIPREEIAVVTGATSKDKRKEIADAMNSGRVRIVFGSTDSLGVGVNMQKNLRAMHHMDAPWMPGELEQRNGRGHRQGNQWNTVLEYRYLTDRLDGRRWQVLAIKQRFITDFMKSKGDVRVIEGDAASDEQSDILSTFSDAAGDPRVLVKEKLKKKLEQLQSRERIHAHAQAEAIRAAERLRGMVRAAEKQLADIKAAGITQKATDLIESQRGESFRAEIGGRSFAKRTEAAEFVQKWLPSELRLGEDRPIGTYGGMPLHAIWDKHSSVPDLYLNIGDEIVSSNGPSLQSLETDLRNLRDDRERKIVNRIEEGKRSLAHNEAVTKEPFHMADKLADTQKQLSDLERDIAENPVAPPYWLRTGAPVDTQVFWNDKPFVVTGHRWNNDGWFVLASDARGDVAIPYAEARDSQGMPVYEEREFQPPTVIQKDEAKPEGEEGQGDEKFSVAGDGLRNAVTSGVLGPVVSRLIDSGAVVLHDTPDSLPAGVKRVTGMQAVTTRGKIHLIGSGLSPQSARAVLLHEAFHQGGEKLIGTEQWNKMMGRLDGLYRQGRQSSGRAREFFDAARARVQAAEAKGAVGPDLTAEEFAAYAIEEYESAPATVRKWVDDLIGMVKAWVQMKFGKQLGEITPAQLSALAKMAVMDMAADRRETLFGRAGELFSAAREFITIDGKERPTTNSEGKPISYTTAGLRDFYKWFGDSKVVDEQGRPLVMSHWTDQQFDAFQPSNLSGGLMYFGEDSKAAKRAARGKKVEIKAYVRMENPLNTPATSIAWHKAESAGNGRLYGNALTDHPGNDGVYVKDEAGVSVAVTDPTQIKSVDNIGTWNGNDPRIMYSVAADAAPAASTAIPEAAAESETGLTPPEPGRLRRLQAALQDNMNRVKQVQDRIAKLTGLPVSEAADYYGAETNRPGRIAARMEDAQKNLTGPLMQRLAEEKRTPEQLAELLHAMHAEERNAKIREINPDEDAGSGMTDAKAREILAKYKGDRVLHRIAQQARDIAKATLDLKLEYGLITQETHDTLSNGYENYVPLKGEFEHGPKIKRAMGHGERQENILEHISRDYNQAISVGEKNLARQSLLQLVLQNPNEDLWTVRVPPRGRRIAGQVFMVRHNGETIAQFDSLAQASAFVEGKGGNLEVVDAGGERVVEYAKPLQDNEVMVYVKGEPIRMQFKDEALARQLRPLDQGRMHPILEFMRGMNRYLSKIYTGYNPAFILRNTTRDAMTGTINILGNQGGGVAAKTWAKYPGALKALGQWAATGKLPAGQAGKYLNEYRMHGGKTGASWMSDLEEQGKKLSTLYEDAYGAGNYLKEGHSLKAAKVAGRKIVGGMAHVVEIGNQATENALRLSLFMALRERGVSPGKAAQAAKTVTVDFDRKGSSTGALGAIYLFFNPAVQGTANAFKTLATGPHKAQAFAALGALALLGLWAAGQGMDDDKDRWLGEGWETRTKNLILNIGGHHIRVPMSQEFAPVYAFGVAMAEVMRGESPMRSALRLVSSFIDAYFPLQGAFNPESDNHQADLALAVTPTLIKPGMQVAFNRNSFGSQIVPESEYTKDRPDNLKMFRGTKNSAYDKAAQQVASLGEILGAGKYENDLSKVSPETLKMLWRQYTGGLGQFVADTAGLAGMAVTDPDGITPDVLPLTYPNDVKAIRGRYYDLTKDARAAIAEFGQAKKAGDGDAIASMSDDKKRLISLGSLVRTVNKSVAAIRDQAVTINADASLSAAEKRENLKELEGQEEALYRQAIGAFKQ